MNISESRTKINLSWFWLGATEADNLLPRHLEFLDFFAGILWRLEFVSESLSPSAILALVTFLAATEGVRLWPLLTLIAALDTALYRII